MKRKIVLLLLATMVTGSLAACGGKEPAEPVGREITVETDTEPSTELTGVLRDVAKHVKDVENSVDRIQHAKYMSLIKELSKYPNYSWYIDGSVQDFVESLTDEFSDRLDKLYDKHQSEIAALLTESETTGRIRIDLSGTAITGYEGNTLKQVIESFGGLEYDSTCVYNGDVIVIYTDDDGVFYKCVVEGTGVESDVDQLSVTDYSTDWTVSYVEQYAGVGEFETDINDFFSDWYDYTDNERYEVAISADENYSTVEAEEGTVAWWKKQSIEYYYKWSAPVDTDEQQAYFKQYSHRKQYDNFDPAPFYVDMLTSDVVAEENVTVVMGGTTSGFEQEGIMFNNDKFIYFVVPYIEGNEEELPICYAEQFDVTRDSLTDWFKSTPYVVDSVQVIEPGYAVMRLRLMFDTEVYLTFKYPTNFAEAPELIDQLDLLARFNATYIITDDKEKNFSGYWNDRIEQLMDKVEVDFLYDSYSRWTEDTDYEDSYVFGMDGYTGNYNVADFEGLAEIMVGQAR